MLNLEASPTISESRFAQEIVNEGGHAVHLNSHPTETNCLFEDNRGDEEGSFIE